MMKKTTAVPTGEARLQTLAMPADTNPSGDIFGGWLLSQMDVAGAIHAKRRARGRVVTVGIEAMNFHLPVYVGDQVSCFCKTSSVGRTSVVVRVETWVMRSDLSEELKVTEGTFTYVAVDEEGRKRGLPEEDVAHDESKR